MVGQRIRYYRKTKGLTQEELAQGICSVSYLSKIEKGDAKSSEEVINLLCERLGISPEEVDESKILEMLNEWNLMMVNRKFNEVEDYYNDVIKNNIKTVMNPDIILRYELFLLRFYLVKNEHDLVKAHQLIIKIGNFYENLNPDLKFYYLYLHAVYYNFLKDYKKSLELLLKAESIYTTKTQNINQNEGAVLYYSLALTYNYLCRITSVNHYAYKAIAIFDKEYNFSRSADCQILLGISNRRVSNYSQAEYHLHQALKYSEAFNDKFTNGVVYHNLGYIASCQKQHKKAIDYYQRSLNEKENQPIESKISTILLLAKEFFVLSDIDKTKYWLDKGFYYLDKIEHNEFYYHFHILKFHFENDMENLETFLAKDAIPFFEEQNIWEKVSELSEELANRFFEQGSYKKSSKYYRIANNARKKIF